MTDLVQPKDNEVALPAYLCRQPDGVFVNLPLFPVGGGFDKFIDRLFFDGYRFVRLNYQFLMDLLFDYDVVLDEYGIDAKIKLADDILIFPAKRKALYKAVKLDSENRSAEYFFEPVFVEVAVEVPVYSEESDDGVRHITGSEIKSELTPTSLDVDEFIADMWLKGIRFGIAIDEIAGVISRHAVVRMAIATQLDPTRGNDAEIEEASGALHRDNSPKILPNGKADLRKFQNRFPQVEIGTRLLKKKIRLLGKPGYKVNGNRIDPEIPNDIDLLELAGIGTRVDILDGYEYIVATRNGFLSLDTHNNHIEVTEKIENKAGVSLKTTGDLSLDGKEFIEHGEVQEGRVVEGKNMTFHSDVFGTVISKGGDILLDNSLSNGMAKSIGGNVTSNGNSFNSTVEAHDGVVTLKYAESCYISGQSIVIEHAINCDIVAENVEIELSEGCGIAGKRVKIAESNSSRGKETNISIILPDLTVFETQIRQVNKAILNCNQILKTINLEIAKITSNEEVAKYLTLALSVKQSSVKLTAAHQENWMKMTHKFSKIDHALEKLNLEKQEQNKSLQAFRQEIEYLIEGREKTGKGIQCNIFQIVGETLVRTMPVYDGIHGLHKINAEEIKVKLRDQGLAQARLLFNDEGDFNWEYKLPEIVP